MVLVGAWMSASDSYEEWGLEQALRPLTPFLSTWFGVFGGQSGSTG